MANAKLLAGMDCEAAHQTVLLLQSTKFIAAFSAERDLTCVDTRRTRLTFHTICRFLYFLSRLIVGEKSIDKLDGLAKKRACRSDQRHTYSQLFSKGTPRA